MRVLVADDEPLARARLAALLGQCEGVQVVASEADGEAALAACIRARPDLLLLDINMPGLEGMTLARRLAALPTPPQVVFCTAHANFAAEAYELGAADYLLKPVRLERLREALARATRLGQSAAVVVPAALHVRVRGELMRIALDDIAYLEADEKYVTVHHAAGTALIEDSLRQLERAHPQQFLRLHRSFLVPRARLLGLRILTDGRVVARLAGTAFEPEVSRRNLAAVRALLR